MESFPARMFLAMPVPASLLGPVRDELGRYSRVLKVVAAENYHITLRFLGDTGRRQYDELVSALDSQVLPARVECTFTGLGCFPSTDSPRVIWAGMNCAEGEMERIVMLAEKSAALAGFAPETKKFSPHLTLARTRRDADVPPALMEYIRSNSSTEYFSHVFDRVVLYESILKKSGPEYSEIRAWNLS